ncbi:MAG: hypothetical protein KZQ76_06335, partial [Candidatus Thiodiazotropha sp. (ex Epidulcina cf. delphinae)]|nr:hypothetical protein [Candidatus Thiodiazotropha sp. (ex Epidulcina cf. delphinae)]
IMDPAQRIADIDPAQSRDGLCVLDKIYPPLRIPTRRATTRNSHAVPRRCNVAMRPRKRAIHPVAWFPQQVNRQIEVNGLPVSGLVSGWSEASISSPM